METADALIEYFDSSNKAKIELQHLIDSNSETHFVDLEDVRNHNPELHSQIQDRFMHQYKSLRETFKTYSLQTVGRPLDLAFFNPSRRLPLRNLRSNTLGCLVSFKGTATRSSQVRPELCEGVFRCRDCGTRIANVAQDHKYTEPLFCPNDLCSNRTKYDVELNESTFTNWQRINVQEDNEEVPEGSLPRTIDLIVRNELVEHITPGSSLIFTGYTAAIPSGTSLAVNRCAPVLEGVADEKPRRVSKDMDYKIVFFCIHANVATESSDFTETELEIIRKIQSSPGLYEKLYNSLFPTIYGHSNIKASILLMLAGGVSKTKNGMKIRGDINLLLVGDPGTAKSQFLKHTAAIQPRAIYTSGKSSTAAGLTAAVVKDGETGEFTIEAGALMLADNGVCCIDEFDKMTYKDQVSIHEAMEQQTITIAKAGINASLNSRTSILAAANPIRGRYDKRRSLRQNINLSAPIMSRFDLYFVLIDDISELNDKKISEAILNNHLVHHPCYRKKNTFCSSSGPSSLSTFTPTGPSSLCPFTIDEVVLYIKYIKSKKPVLLEEAAELLITKYIGLRQDSLLNTNNYKMTARHLESLIRLSEALAKIHNDTVVGISHIEEAHRLIKSSVVEVCGEDITFVTKENVEPFVITSKDYLRIMNSLVYLVKSFKLNRNELCLRYLELIEENIGSTEQLATERTKCERTIDFLIENEGVMFEVDDVVFVHPNFDN